MGGQLKQESMKFYAKKIWPFVKPLKMSFMNLFLCIIVTSFIGTLYPFLFGILIDEVFYHRNIEFFRIIIFGYAIIYLSEQSLQLVLNMTWSYLMTRFLFDIRKKMYERVLSMKISLFNRMQVGNTMAMINRDTDEVMNLITANVFYLTANVVRLVTAIVFVLLINVYVGLLMLVVVPISVFIAMIFGRYLKKQLELNRNSYGHFISWTVEMLSGLRDIRLLAAERNITRHFVKHCIKLIRTSNNTSRIEWMSERSIAFVSLLSDLALYAFAAFMIVQGELTIGGFIAIIEYFKRASGLLQNLSSTNTNLQRNKVSINRVIGILDGTGENTSNYQTDLKIMQGVIEFKDVTFQYPDGEEVLKGVELYIGAGETVAIVGRSGAGKSTLISLVLRFYEPTKGSICIDGRDISAQSLKSLRKQISVVQQESLMFDGTIRSNLLMGNKMKTDADLWEACERAYLADFIRTLPKGFDTLVGSSGVSLSGGQKQRIAIAKVFLKKSNIFIFDEATSALDGEAEMAVQNAFKLVDASTTKIIIAHRLSTIISSDKVAVLYEGQIVAFGHHLELLETNNHYRKLFLEQYQGNEEEAI
jgi:ATP-binding cassette subfamily B protein